MAQNQATMITKNLKETEIIAKEIASKIQNKELICLFGDIGSGKTTFTRYMAKYLGINEFSIKSPTFTFIREYKTKDIKLYHIDLYRLDSEDQNLIKEIKELIEDNNIVIIEWAEKILNHLPEKKLNIKFEYVDDTSRKIEIIPSSQD